MTYSSRSRTFEALFVDGTMKFADREELIAYLKTFHGRSGKVTITPDEVEPAKQEQQQ